MATIAPPVVSTTTRTVGETTDHQLVAGVRAGDDRAFEQLYQRYHRRIAAYIYGMVNDYARAEDITQDVFMSALRRMRETDRTIAFKPWIYEIAKNACIDQFRRSRRAEEVSYDAEDGLAPADYGRLAMTGPTPDVAVDQKLSLDHLCGAFGGLSETHHEILVMRELEGLSYREIGERLGMSRPSVESTLFRARRRLTEEYSELVSGERCHRIQGIIATASAGTLGTRDQRRMARHISYCQPCRRQARMAGLDSSVLVHTPVRAKIAAFLPLPAFLRRRWGGGGDSASGLTATHAPTVAQWSSAVADPSTAGWIKAAATAATIAIAGAGAGAAVNSDSSMASRLSHAAAEQSAPAPSQTGSAKPVASRSGATRSGSSSAQRAARHRSSGTVTKTTVTPVKDSTTSAGTSSGTATASAPISTDSTSPTTAPSIGTSSGGSRPASGGSTSSTSVSPISSGTSGGSLPVPNVTTVTDTGTKAGDVVTQTVTTVTGTLTGG